jgi:hypothetical protein
MDLGDTGETVRQLLGCCGWGQSRSEGKQFGACYLAGTAGHARRFRKQINKESK